MTVSPALSVFLRRAARWAAGLVALGVAGFATVAALMFFWVLPNIADHRDSVAQLMSRALGQRVTLEAVSGVWQQARPEFRLRGVRLYDAQGRPALYLPQLDAAFAWRSLLVFEPRFSHIELQGLSLDVRRARDGHFYVGGIPVNPADPQSRFSSWLLRQGRVHVGNATLTWLDEVRSAPPLVLQRVDFALENARHRHRVRLRAVPPPSLAQPLLAEAQLSSRDTDDVRTWSGALDASLRGVSFPRIAPWLALPYQPQQGGGALQLRFEVADGTLAGVRVGMDLRAVETRLGAGLPPLRLAQVHGTAVWQRDADGQHVGFENLRVARRGGALGAPFNMGLRWVADTREITARSFSLGGWADLLPALPMDEALRARLQTLHPVGRFDTLRLRWNGPEPGLDNFSVDARFRGLGVATIDNQPGLANLTGQVAGDARGGRFEIDSSKMELNLPALFREPVIVVDRAQARGSWTRTARGQRLKLDELVFANADMAGTAKGSYEFIRGQRGVADLEAQLSRAAGPAVYRYLPRRIGDHTVDWVKHGVLAGHAESVQFELRGDLAHFPFEQGKGVFRVEAQVQGGVIDYVSGWPRIEGIEGRLLFHGKVMEVDARQARIYGVALTPVKVVIPDLLHHDEMLLVDGEAQGPARDFIRFANGSPLRERLRGFTDALEGDGPMKLALKLQVPLRRSDDTTLAGRLSFLGNTLQPAALPRLEQVRGEVAFTGDGLGAQAIGAQFLGGPLRIDARTRDGQVQVLAQGRATAAGLAAWAGAEWGGRLSGQSAWRGQLDLDAASTRIRIESDLVGMGSSLPLPLAKAAPQALPLLVTGQPAGTAYQYEVRLGRTVGAIWRSEAGRPARGELRFGGPAVMPTEPGLRLAGSGRAMDISGWLALLPRDGDAAAVPLSSIDLDFDALDLMGRRFADVRLQGRTRGSVLRTQVSGRGMNGALAYRPAAGDKPARVSVQFSRLTLPARVGPAAVPAGVNMRAADFPVLDVNVDDFRVQDHALGRLEAVAHGAPQGLVIESLQLTHADSVFRMSGLWRDSLPSETRAELSLTVNDAGKFLARFGQPDTLRRGSVEIKGNATWEGAPGDFAFDTLAGQLDFKAKGGQFLKIDPGAGKLLGVLSLQSLPRRLSFDFRDIFNEGYAFDDIGATLRIARGVIYSDDFKMRGPAAKVNMSGLADLNQESVQLRVKVIPKVSEGVAVAGALIAGPLAGVGALAAQKLLRDPVEEAISQEYMVTGPWLAPDVRRLTKPKAATENPVSEP